jgi:ribonuclease BN (tRNA processing enzyme)
VEAVDGDRTWRILLDLGSGALGYLQRFIDPLDVDALFLSHLHPDHFFDISGYYVMRKYHPEGPQPRIPVWGPKGTARRAAVSYGLPPEPGMTEEFDFYEYDGQPVRVGPFTITTSRLVHPVESYGLLLAEASFREGEENPEELHLTGRQAGKAAARAGVGTLVLTHIPPWHDREPAMAEARLEYDGRIELARTGATFDV